jgi:hypothetical protein
LTAAKPAEGIKPAIAAMPWWPRFLPFRSARCPASGNLEHLLCTFALG